MCLILVRFFVVVVVVVFPSKATTSNDHIQSFMENVNTGKHMKENFPFSI